MSSTDRSIPRDRVRAGDTSTDRRGRDLRTAAWLSYGFRPFFLGASIHAALLVPLWLWVYWSGEELPGPFAGSTWHAHEMIFGYLGAVMAGFILTAIPNWTGRLPLSGYPLAVLFGLWLAGRVAVATVDAPLAVLAVDLAFPSALAAAVWREVMAGGNWRNAPVALLLTLFALANLLHHLEAARPELAGAATRLSLGVAAMLIALIGGRITPSFTRNWLARRSAQVLPAPSGRLDRAALAAAAIAVAAWNVAPTHALGGWLLAAAGILLLARLTRWRGLDTLAEPMLVVLHLGYLWLAVSFVMLGLAVLRPDIVADSTAVHALTAGAIGTMTLAVMTRATRGHTGHGVEADRWTVAIYLLVTAGALMRVIAPFLAGAYLPVLLAGGALWSTAFGLFAARYGPMLVRRRG